MNKDHWDMVEKGLEGLHDRYETAMEEQFQNVPGLRELNDEEFKQWFDAMLTLAAPVMVEVEKEPATKWFPKGTILSGPDWLLMVAMPTVGWGREVGRYTRLTGKVNPFKAVNRGGSN